MESVDLFRRVHDELQLEPIATALLVLAEVIDRKHVFDKSSGENFGHELALSLKHVFENSRVSVDLSNE